MERNDLPSRLFQGGEGFLCLPEQLQIIPAARDADLFRSGSKTFFFEKRSKKLLDIGTRASPRPKPNEKKFLVLFFKKEPLAFFAKSQPQSGLA